MATMAEMDAGLLAAIAAAGSIGKLARALGLRQQAVQQWRSVPAGRIIAVEQATGVDRAVLRPDLYERRPTEQQRPARR